METTKKTLIKLSENEVKEIICDHLKSEGYSTNPDCIIFNTKNDKLSRNVFKSCIVDVDIIEY